ncbi:penicillin-binding protein 1A [Roseateles sp.]|uniref:penicillin-binding protein 1A n=1 Tax=Roseateles sp. TaxID=1971397 RepID=UPI00391B381E
MNLFSRLLARVPEHRRGMVRRLLIIAGAGVAGLVLLLATAAVLIYPTLPDLSELTDYRPKQPLRVYTADGVQIGEFGAERRRYLPLDQIPKSMQDALLAIEDTQFYEHGGLSYTGIARAALSNLFSARSQGASTITQQLARDFYLTKKKLYSRKFIEMLLTLKMERTLSKQQILEIYMNQIYLGQRAYGFEAAARVYFGKSLQALSIAETAMLAGLPQNPIYANPVNNPTRAARRQRVVLQRMHEVGLIDAAQLEAAKAEKLHIRSAQDPRLHAEFVAEMVRQQIHAQYGDEAYTLGLQVFTTLESGEQAAAYRGLRRSLMEHERRKPYRGPEGRITLPANELDRDAAIAKALSEHPDNDDLRAAVVTEASPTKVLASLQSGEDISISGDGLRAAASALSPKAKAELRLAPGAIIRVLRGAPSKADPKGTWVITQLPEAAGALVALEPGSGRVRALVGGFDFAKNQFNHATQAWRQPGSSFKPFVYSAALEQGITPATVVEDAPIVIGDWTPKNSDGQFDGPMSVRQGLAKSKNMVTIRVLQQLGPGPVREWAARFGLDAEKQPDNLTLALGAGAVTPMQMASAYAVFANGGHLLKASLIAKVVDAKGQLLYEATTESPTEENRVISSRNAFVTSSLLQEVTRSGTAARASVALRRGDIYGKTGTTNDAVDAWFAGFHPTLVAVVWMGYDQPRSLGERESGGGLALPAWVELMAEALKGVPVRELPPTDGVLPQAGDWVFEEYAGEAAIQVLSPPGQPGAAASSP